MNKEISKILRDRLREGDGLPFVEKYAGLVQTVEKVDESAEGGMIRKRFPVSTEVVINGCEVNEDVMTPESSLKGLIYFEDNGTIPNGRVGHRFQYVSNVTLICWINRAKILSNIYSEITGIAIQNIVEKLKIDQNAENVGMFSGMTVSMTRINPQDVTIFTRYSYDENVSQYLRPPFEFFSLGLQIKYFINPECVQPIEIKNDLVCY